MSNGPLPSKLTLLSNLPTRASGDKVRFLGCVTSYSMASAELTLVHNFPKPSEARAVVDVRLLLEKINAEQTSVGHWVNVIGYIASPPKGSAKRALKLQAGPPFFHIQAVMLWSAGPLDISRYETSLADMAETTESEAKRNKPETG